MKLHLTNFRCYENNTFDLGSNGLTLINGPSGHGKSSLLMAIQFALYGTGTKIVTHGKTQCRVELSFDDGTSIIRTRRPNRLVVNNNLEDDEAQSFINKIFGDTFDVTSYISQNAINSFVTMSPVDKLAFLENYAFKDVDLPSMKSRCKAVITQTNENLIQITSQLQMARSFLESSQPPSSPVPFPIKCKQSQIPLAIKNEENKTKNCLTLIKKKQKEQLHLSEKLSEITKISTQISCFKDQLSDIQSEITSVESEIDSLNYEGDHVLQDLKSSLSNLETHREILNLKSDIDACQIQLDEIKHKETSELNDKISALSSSLWDEYSRADIIDTINSLKLCKKSIDSIITLQSELESISLNSDPQTQLKKIDDMESELLSQTTLLSELTNLYSCPSCNCALKMKNNILVKSSLETSLDLDTKKIQASISSLQKSLSREKQILSDINIKSNRLSTITSKLASIRSEWDDPIIQKIIDQGYAQCSQDISDLDSDLSYSESYLDHNTKKQSELDAYISRLKTEQFSNSFSILKSTLEKKKQKLASLSSISLSIPQISESELRSSIQDITLRQHTHNKLVLSLNSLIQKQSDLQSKIDKGLASISSDLSIESISSQLSTIKQDLLNLETKLSHQTAIIEKIEKYKAYVTSKEKYDELNSKVTELEANENIAKNEYSAACKLKTKIQEAEAIAISQVISSINIHAQMFIDAFFDDNPMSIQLLSFKESKKGTKPQINMEIFYKGSQCDLASLSGGEYARVVLAFTLALSEMNNCPLILLDECTASLDQDLTTTVLEKIKSAFTSRTVLVIAHQVVGGCFDHVISV